METALQLHVFYSEQLSPRCLIDPIVLDIYISDTESRCIVKEIELGELQMERRKPKRVEQLTADIEHLKILYSALRGFDSMDFGDRLELFHKLDKLNHCPCIACEEG